MSFRRRLTLAAAAAMAVVALVTAAAAYGIVRGALRGQIDDSLRERADPLLRVGGGRPGPFTPAPPVPRAGRFGGPAGYVQVIDPGGRAARFAGSAPLPSVRASCAAGQSDHRPALHKAGGPP